MFVVSIRSNGRLCGYWPFWEKRLDVKDAFVRVIEPIGSRVTDYVMPLVAKDHDRPALVSMMLAALEDELSPRCMILWSKAEVKRAANIAIAKNFPRGKTLIHCVIRRCPRMALTATYAELEARWSRNHRSQLRRRIKRLQEQGDLKFFVAGTRSEIQQRLPILFEMHQRNWWKRGGGSELKARSGIARMASMMYRQKHGS